MTPCKGCQEREIGCHGSCEKYLAWKNVRDEINRKNNIRSICRELSRDHEKKYREHLKQGRRRK